MKARYREWVENLHWDWGISRQRTFGVPFPV
jgi:valyl-tRNA synthetase